MSNLTYTKKRMEAEINDDKDKKPMNNQINNCVQSKSMENVRNIVDVRLISNNKDYLKWT